MAANRYQFRKQLESTKSTNLRNVRLNGREHFLKQAELIQAIFSCQLTLHGKLRQHFKSHIIQLMTHNFVNYFQDNK